MLKYVCVGPKKCGTTWLYHNLDLLKTYSFPIMEKEIFYWDKYYDRGLDWYYKNFHHSKNMAEISPSYFTSSKACRSLHSYNEELKILILLRDPVDRCVSHFKHHYRKGRIPYNIKKAVEMIPEIKEASHYKKYCSMWLESFGDKKVKIIPYDEIRQKPLDVIREIVEFFDNKIEVERSDFDFSARNLATYPRNYFIAKILTNIADTLRDLRMYKLVNFGKSLKLQKIYSGGKCKKEIHQKQLDFINNWFEEDMAFLAGIIKER